MLNIFIGRENLPEDKKFIFDVEAVFLNVGIHGSEFQKYVIETVDKGSYVDKIKFKDRFGNMLYYSELSTGAKALLMLDYFKDFIINFDEVGLNAIELLKEIEDGNIFFSSRSDKISVNDSVIVNGVLMTDEELNSLIKGGKYCANHGRCN